METTSVSRKIVWYSRNERSSAFCGIFRRLLEIKCNLYTGNMKNKTNNEGHIKRTRRSCEYY